MAPAPFGSPLGPNRKALSRRASSGRALCLVLSLVLVPPVLRWVFWPRAVAQEGTVGLLRLGALRVYPEAEARRLAEDRARDCDLRPPPLPRGFSLLGDGCALRVRPLPLGARRVLNLERRIDELTLDDFESLHGIGPALSARISQARFRKGPFRSVEDLLAVPGIGPARVERIRAALRPAGAPCPGERDAEQAARAALP